MRVIIAGSRTITAYDVVCKAIEKSGFDITEVVSGGARGVDKLGEQWAIENNIPFVRFPADWDTYGKRAGDVRNVEMADYALACILVWDGVSKGTDHMFNIARDRGLEVYMMNH